MKVLQYKGINQSGANCRGFVLLCNFGFYYLACKPEHKPDDPWLTAPVKDFWSSSAFGEQFLYSLSPAKNDHDIIERLFFYLDGDQVLQGLYGPDLVIDFIAQELQQKRLMVYLLHDKKQLFSNIHIVQPQLTIPPLTSVASNRVITVCSIEQFTLKCGHDGHSEKDKDGKTVVLSDRKYTHNMLSGKYKDDLFEVIGKDKILVHAHGFCKSDKSTCPSVKISGPGVSETKVDEEFSIEVMPPLESTIKSKDKTKISFKDVITPMYRGFKANIYKFQALGCDNNYPLAKVGVYDIFNFEGFLNLKLEKDEKSENPDMLGLTLTSTLKGNTAGIPWQVSIPAKLKNFLEGLLAIINKLYEIANAVTEKTHDVAAISKALKTKSIISNNIKSSTEFNFKFPNISLGGNMELVELEKSPAVGLDGNLYLKFSPLFGVNVKLDLIEWLIITFTGPYIVLLKEARDDIKKGIDLGKVKVKGELVLDLEFDGDFTGELLWEYKQGVGKAKGDLSQLYGMKITAKVEGVAEAYILSVKAVVKAGIEIKTQGEKESVIGLKFSGYASLSDNTPTLGLKALFTGLKFVYSKYCKTLIADQEVQDTASAVSSTIEKGFESNDAVDTSIPVEVSGMSGYLKPMIAKAKADAQNFHYMNETMETSTGSELLVWKEHVLYDTGKEDGKPKDDKPKDDKPKEGTFVNADL